MRALNITRLWVGTICGEKQFIDGIDVGLGGGNDNVRIGPLTVHDAPPFLETHGDFPLSISATGNGVDRVEQQILLRVD